MFDNVKNSEMAEFNRTRTQALIHALTVGVRLVRRPDVTRVDEQNTILRPECLDPDGHGTHLAVGKKAVVDYNKMDLWGLPVERHWCYPSNRPNYTDNTMTAYVLMFGRMPIIGKCRVEAIGDWVNVAAIARRNRYYNPDSECTSAGVFESDINKRDSSYMFWPDIGSGRYFKGQLVKEETSPEKLLLYPLNCLS